MLVDLGIAAVDAKYRPKVFAFSQLGFGRPGLNFLDTQFRPWMIAGVRLSWDIYDWGAGRIEKETFALQKELVKVQQDAFKRQTDLGLIQVDEDLHETQETAAARRRHDPPARQNQGNILSPTGQRRNHGYRVLWTGSTKKRAPFSPKNYTKSKS
jgi:outer membrane protein TolC